VIVYVVIKRREGALSEKVLKMFAYVITSRVFAPCVELTEIDVEQETSLARIRIGPAFLVCGR